MPVHNSVDGVVRRPSEATCFTTQSHAFRNGASMASISFNAAQSPRITCPVSNVYGTPSGAGNAPSGI